MRYNHTVVRDMSQKEDRYRKRVKEGPNRNNMMSGCRETWGGVDRCRGADSSRGAKPSLCNVLLVLTVNFSSLYCAETTGD